MTDNSVEMVVEALMEELPFICGHDGMVTLDGECSMRAVAQAAIDAYKQSEEYTSLVSAVGQTNCQYFALRKALEKIASHDAFDGQALINIARKALEGKK